MQLVVSADAKGDYGGRVGKTVKKSVPRQAREAGSHLIMVSAVPKVSRGAFVNDARQFGRIFVS